MKSSITRTPLAMRLVRNKTVPVSLGKNDPGIPVNAYQVPGNTLGLTARFFPLLLKNVRNICLQIFNKKTVLIDIGREWCCYFFFFNHLPPSLPAVWFVSLLAAAALFCTFVFVQYKVVHLPLLFKHLYKQCAHPLGRTSYTTITGGP